MKINPNDPKWTAYVLGELDADERVAIDELLAGSSEARALVEELRIAATMLKDELDSQPAAALNASQRAAIHAAADRNVHRRRGPRVVAWAASFAAAALIVFAVLTPSSMPPRLATQPKSAETSSIAADSAASAESPRAKVFTLPSQATNARGQRIGTAKDASGAVLPGAEVTTTDAETRQSAVNPTLQVGQLAERVEVQPIAALRGAAAPAGDRLDRTARNIVKTETYDQVSDNPFIRVTQDPLATFSIDVDTGSYVNVRRFINQSQLPPKDAVRIEQMINFFSYDYPQSTGTGPIGAQMEVASAPWNPEHRLVRVGIKGKELDLNRVVAKDVKIQLEFNPAQVSAYRLIGYENRLARNEPFKKDLSVVAEMNAGRTVTALFEIVPAGVGTGVAGQQMLTLNIAYTDPDGSESKRLEVPLMDSGKSFASASSDFRFAASVAAFGMILRDSPYKGTASLSDVLDIAQSSKGPDLDGSREEFIRLVSRARSLAEINPLPAGSPARDR